MLYLSTFCVSMHVYFVFSLFFGLFSFTAFSFSTLILLVGSLTCKNRLLYNLYCVGGDVKHCTIQCPLVRRCAHQTLATPLITADTHASACRYGQRHIAVASVQFAFHCCCRVNVNMSVKYTLQIVLFLYSK